MANLVAVLPVEIMGPAQRTGHAYQALARPLERHLVEHLTVVGQARALAARPLLGKTDAVLSRESWSSHDGLRGATAAIACQVDIQGAVTVRALLLDRAGEALADWERRGPHDALFLIMRDLVEALHEALGLEPSAREIATLERIPTRSFGAFCHLAMAMAVSDDDDELRDHRLALLRDATESDPLYANAYLARAAALRAVGRDQEAHLLLTAFVDAEPDAPLALRRALASVAAATGDIEQALEILETLAMEWPYATELHIQRVALLIDEERLDEAMFALFEALARSPNDPTLMRLHARVQSSQGALDDARQTLERALELRPDDADLHAERARLCLHLGDRAGGAQALEHALRLRPDDPLTRRAFAQLLLLTRRPGQACLQLFAAFAQQPHDPNVTAELASALIQIDDTESARHLIDRLDLDEGGIPALRARVELALLEGRLEVVASLLKDVASLDAEQLWLWAVEVAARGGDMDGARNLIERRLGPLSPPDNPTLLFLIARLERLAGRAAAEGDMALLEATSLLLLEHHPTTDCVVRVARLKHQTGDLRGAMAWFDALLSNKPGGPPPIDLALAAMTSLHEHGLQEQAARVVSLINPDDHPLPDTARHALAMYTAALRGDDAAVERALNAALTAALTPDDLARGGEAIERVWETLTLTQGEGFIAPFLPAVEAWTPRPDSTQGAILKGKLLQLGGALESAADVVAALLVSHDLAEVHALAGWVHERQGQRALALTHWRRAHLLSPHATDVTTLLGTCLLSDDRAREALPCFEKALQQSPGDMNVLHALRAAVALALAQSR